MYFLAGLGSAAVSISVRELVGRGVGDAQTQGYVLSIFVAYVLGTVTSYVLNRRFTFTEKANSLLAVRRERFWFAMTALAGMGLTTVLAVGLRWVLDLSPLFPALHSTLAFIIAALITSVFTFLFNQFFTFRAQ